MVLQWRRRSKGEEKWAIINTPTTADDAANEVEQFDHEFVEFVDEFGVGGRAEWAGDGVVVAGE